MNKESIPHTIKNGNVPILDRLRELNKTELHAVLATDSDGQPYTSLIAFALTEDCQSIVFATPVNSQKYRNMNKNKNVSILIDNRTNTSKDYMEAELITIVGHARHIEKSDKWKELSQILREKHPHLEAFINAPSTALIDILILYCVHVSQFQTVTEWKRENKMS